MYSTSGGHESAIQKATRYLQTVSPDDCYRQTYHVSPPAGWMNDPNGLLYYEGEYHVFFQYHPYSAEWGPMHWGHVKSKDLVVWEHLPIALAPSEFYDKDGCFSGSAVEHDGMLTLIYTGNVGGVSPRQVQCIAASRDGITFEKWPVNPVIPASPFEETQGDFRDPKVWKFDNSWYMIVGGRMEYAKALLYRSNDLVNWEYTGVAAESSGAQGSMWECPDLFELDGQDVLIVSPMGMENHKNIYIVGKMDYISGKFKQESFGELDYGQDFYAAQTFQDPEGRRILVAWMSNWRNPNTTKEFGWSGSLTLPRELFWLPDGSLGMRPVMELQKMRASHRTFSGLFDSGLHFLAQGATLEVQTCIDVNSASASAFGLKLRCSPDGREETVVLYQDGELIVDRSKSGDLVANPVSKHPIKELDGKVKLHIFVDTSSIEIFVNDGACSISNRIYPAAQSQGTYLFVNHGEVKFDQLDVWELDTTHLINNNI